jgi:hypothetical protein
MPSAAVCSTGTKALSKFSKMPMIVIGAAVSVALLWLYYKLSNLQSKFASEIKDLRNSVMQLQVCAAKVTGGSSPSSDEVCFLNTAPPRAPLRDDELSICSEAVNDILNTVLAPSKEIEPVVEETFAPQEQEPVVVTETEPSSSSEVPEYSEADLKKHTLEELKALATKLGESAKGNKPDLIQRILTAKKNK